MGAMSIHADGDDAGETAGASGPDTARALQWSEERFRSLVEATASVVWTAAPDGSLKQSDSWERFTGQLPEEYTGPAMGGFEAVHPDDRDELGRRWAEVLAEPRRLDTTYRLRRADGEYRRVRVTTVPVSESDGSIREWIGAATDVEDEMRTGEELVRQGQLTETITENATSALFLMDALGKPTYLNSAAEKMFGYRIDEIRDVPLHDVVHHTRPDGTAYPIAECPIDRALLESRWVEPYEDLFVRRDGAFVPVRAAASPILRDGVPVGTVVEVQDVTGERQLLEDERRARLRAQLLERNATRLVAAASVAEVASAALQDLGTIGLDGGAVRLLDRGVVRLLAADGMPAEFVDAVSDVALEEEPSPAGLAMREDRVVVFGTADELLAAIPEAGRKLMRSLGAETIASFPLRSGSGAVIGALSVGSRTRNYLDDGLQLLLTGLAEQSGLALERAILQAEVAAASERAAFLADLSGSLEMAVTVVERADTAATMLARQFGATVAVHLLRGLSPVLTAVTDPGPTVPAEELREFVHHLLPGNAARRIESRRSSSGAMLVPMVGRGRPLGLVVLEPYDRSRVVLDEPFVDEIAVRLALALDNSLMYEQERDVSHALQIGLLSDVPARIENGLVSYHYRPGSETLEVGGDWYDLFRLPSGSVALVVGDVVGHGLDAAVTMGQLRGAVRAIAAEAAGPADVLSRLDAFVRRSEVASMATAVFAELDLETGELRFACAGHPPPLLVGSEGVTRVLWDGRSAPLGCDTGTPRSESSTLLDKGESVVLFTDGLVERRTESFDIGLARLESTAARLLPFSEDFAGHLSDLLLSSSPHDDDACVLAVQFLPVRSQVFTHAITAGSGGLAGMRAALSEWLGVICPDREVVQSVVLAVSEAAANSVEHGYGFDERGVTTVVANVEPPNALTVTIADRGTWKEPGPPSGRGRGTSIMRACMDEVTVDHDGDGTTVLMRRRLEAGGR
jgi:serine/threonine-protein kinase RsbW